MLRHARRWSSSGAHQHLSRHLYPRAEHVDWVGHGRTVFNCCASTFRQHLLHHRCFSRSLGFRERWRRSILTMGQPGMLLLPYAPLIVVTDSYIHAQIHPKYKAPVNAIYCTAAFSFLLSLIYIGSETAFYAITSLFTVALLQCYMFSIGSILWRRIYLPETIPESSFRLGRWGIPVNAWALLWCAWSFVSAAFPLIKSHEDVLTASSVLVVLASIYTNRSRDFQLGLGYLRRCSHFFDNPLFRART